MMTKKHNNIPALRFPGFSQPWKQVTVSDLLVRESRPVDVQEGEIYREIGVRSHGRGVFHKEPITGGELGDKRVFEVVPGTLVLNIVFAWEQAVAILSENETGFIASHRFPMFSEMPGQSYIPFMRAFFLRPKGKALLELASPGGAGRNKTLGQEEFSKLKVTVPERSEQVRIAGLLETIDKKLVQLERKKVLLERFQASTMLKIFSKEVRFSNSKGKTFPSWTQTTIGEVTHSISTREHQIKSSEILTSGRFKVVDQGQQPIAGFSDNETKLLKLNDHKVIVYGDHTTTIKLVGHDFVVGADGTKVLKSEGIDTTFLYHAMRHFNPPSEGYKRHYGILRNVKIPLPDQDEQIAIAELLSALEKKTTLVKSELQFAIDLKRGFLQKLFA